MVVAWTTGKGEGKGRENREREKGSVGRGMVMLERVFICRGGGNCERCKGEEKIER